MVGLVAASVAFTILVFFGDRLRARAHLPLAACLALGDGQQIVRSAVSALLYTRPSMTPFAGIFGIHNHTVSLVVDAALVVLAVIWLALIYWTFADARRRIGDGMLVACATIVSFIPFLGTVVYMIVRPPEYLDDVHERDLEIRPPRRVWRRSACTPARTATTRSSRSSCAARTACAS